MTEDNQLESEPSASVKPTRRQIIGTLAGTGVLASLASSQGGGGSGSTVLGIGGGDMADAAQELRIKYYKDTMANRPSAGVEGRVYEVWDPSDTANHGKVFHDTGQAWELVERQVGKLTTDDLHTKGTPWFDVTAYGAVGDGSTDDSSAIQSAIDAAGNANGQAVVYFPPRQGYQIETALTVKSGVTYIGDYYSTIQVGDIGDNAAFQNTSAPKNVFFWGLEIDGSNGWTAVASYDTTQKGFFFNEDSNKNPPENIAVCHCFVHDVPATGIGIDNVAGGAWYLYNHVKNCGTSGKTAGSNGIGIGVGNSDIEDHYIIGNRCYGNVQHQITLEAVDTQSIPGDVGHVIGFNTVQGGQVGISAEHVKKLTVVGNSAVGSFGSQAFLLGTDFQVSNSTAPQYVSVTGNVFNGFGSSAVTIETDVKDVICTGNILILGSVTNNGTRTDIKDNVGYVTENSGEASFTGDGSATSFTIAHGLDETPTVVTLTQKAVTSAGEDIEDYDADGSNITVNFTAAPANTETATVGWMAEAR